MALANRRSVRRVPIMLWAPLLCLAIWGASACKPPQGTNGGDCYPETCNRDPYCNEGLECTGNTCRPATPRWDSSPPPAARSCDETSTESCSSPKQREAYLCSPGMMPAPSPLRSCKIEASDAGAGHRVRVCCTVSDECVPTASKGCGAPAVEYACHRALPAAQGVALRCLQLTSFSDGYASYCCTPTDACFSDDVERYTSAVCDPDEHRIDCLGDVSPSGDGGADAGGTRCRVLESLADAGTGTTSAMAYCCER
jgi:hypothetical protein